tara:strand:- start:439 stop:1563 length:1125 start_codon:yes stop_codon:yes gene_type:complete
MKYSAFTLILWLVSSQALASIGDVIEQRGNSMIERQGGEEFVVDTGFGVLSYDTVHTAKGRTAIQFVDDTRVDVTEHSKLLIDEFVYDPNTQTGALSLKAALGTVRYASGQIAKNSRQNIKIRTPTATIAVRGTDFSMSVDEFGQSTVILLPSCTQAGNSLLCTVGEISVESDVGQVVLNQAFQATTVSAVDSAPQRPLLLDPDETFISNLIIIRKPVYADEEEERGRIQALADILDIDFLEYDGLDKDLLALDEEETWYTELDYDPLALEFLFDALERSNAQLAALLKSEFEDVIKETIFGYDPVLNISVIDNEPQFTIIRDDGQGNYIRLDLDNTLAYELNIDQNGNTIEYFELRLNSATPIGNHINIKQSN